MSKPESHPASPAPGSPAGASSLRVILRHRLPQRHRPLTLPATLGIAGAMLTEATVDLPGFGVAAAMPAGRDPMTGAQEYPPPLRRR